MPLIVRLVHGFPPKGLKSGFVPELRLLGCIEVENNIFALPLQKDVELISIPLNAKLKLMFAKNMEQLENFAEYKRLVDKANRLLHDDVENRLQVIDLKLNEKDSKKDCIVVKDSKSLMSRKVYVIIHNVTHFRSFIKRLRVKKFCKLGSQAGEEDSSCFE